MEEKKEIAWESPEVSAEQMVEEQGANNKWLAEVRKQLAESKGIMREMIGRMTDEEVMELAYLCLDELENREYSVLRARANPSKRDSVFTLGIRGRAKDFIAMLLNLFVKR